MTNRPGLPPLPAPVPARPGAPRRFVRRWAAFGLVLAAVAGAVLLVGLRLGLGVEAAKRDLVAALSEASRGAVRVDGPVGLTLLPTTRIVADAVTLEPAGGGTIAVRRLVADLDPLKALFGTAEVKRLRLDGPRFDPPAGAGAALLAQPLDGLAAAGRALPVLSRIDEIEILDGSIPAGRGGVSKADLTLSSGRFTTAVDLEGSFLWNGERAGIDASMERTHDGSLLVEGRIESAALAAFLAGRAPAGPEPRFEGAVSLSAPSLKRAAAWLGHAGPALPEIGPLALDASLVLDDAAADFTDAELLLAGSRGRGALVLVREGAGDDARRPRLDGTLAFADLDLATVAHALAPLPAGPAGLDRPIDVGFLGLLDLDLRLSAQDAFFGPAPVSDLAATLHLERGTATLDLGDAAMLGGRARARLVLDATAAEPAVSGGFALRDADLAALGRAVGVAPPGFAGRASLEGTLDAPVSSWADLAARIRLDAGLTGRDGTLDLSALPTGSAAAPLLAPGLSALPYSRLTARLFLSGPQARLEDVVLDAPGGRLALGGTLARSGTLRLDGRFEPEAVAEGKGPSVWSPASPRRVEVTGAWPAPLVTLLPLGSRTP